MLPLSVGPPSVVVKGFEGACPHATSRAEAAGAEQPFSWPQAAPGTQLVNKVRGFWFVFLTPGGLASLLPSYGGCVEPPPIALPIARLQR